MNPLGSVMGGMVETVDLDNVAAEVHWRGCFSAPRKLRSTSSPATTPAMNAAVGCGSSLP